MFTGFVDHNNLDKNAKDYKIEIRTQLITNNPGRSKLGIRMNGTKRVTVKILKY